ncbi:MAG: CpaF family protein, partial [Candidatus Omnitrophica bacterium]|nr:CpaF family protein [Candidatus Omnitrophota bacterium]
MNKQITNYKHQIKLKLIRSLPTNLKEIEPDIVRNIIRKITESIVKNKLDFNEKEELFESISSEILGHGPIDSLLKDPLITEIMINGCNQIYAEKKGKLSLTAINFYNNDQLLSFVDKILSSAGRRVTELEPFVDARLSDGSRINVVRPPISVIPIVTIRKFNFHTLNIQELIQLNTLNSQISSFLAACVKEQINIIISGGTGSGKTTLLNTLGCFIPKDERVVIVENTRELHLEHPHVVSLECRPPSIDGKGEITLRQLVKNSLHMRPNRIILGEVRG